MNAALRDPLFRRIGEIADAKGVQAFVIGGYVRDWFLHRPCTDIDVVVAGSGIEVAEAMGRRTGSRVSVFKNFGTAMLRCGAWEVEFVGARKESYRADSRKPIVEDGTIEDDQLRRDFTINAMAFSLNAATFGELVDPFDGTGDLERRLIRTPCDPDVTFSDDPLRMIRAVRFAAQLGFDIHSETFDAIGRNKERIAIVSKERIATELNKIMLSPVPSVGFDLFDRTGLLPLIFPELARLKGVERIGGRSHKDNFVHTLKVLDNVARRSDDLWLRWAALLHDIGKFKIPDEILLKPGKLTKEEFEVIKKHTVYGYEILNNFKILESTKRAALLHHEKFDGSGYPFGYTADKIDDISAIITIADVYDAMTSKRCYRDGMCPFDVIADFEYDGISKYHPKYIGMFLKKIASSYIGSTVLLTNGKKAKIIFLTEKYSRPTVTLLEDNSVLVLKDEKDIKIAAVL